ncbi:hypothetical protein E1B28_005825 [Marasmius oreades]|uniref:Zn(2)-C6 fungal-type domain-containing protein n=1 Tax=Marasmius oreades TaxID=181124 RepID=A0A9P7S3Y5_9AGAR|nr:uncharacterized protein E1B28_005825 [Marasmius oreades]KAG7095034.1 hypothetical protein E1B28_005825 [Marasmius oreades]
MICFSNSMPPVTTTEPAEQQNGSTSSILKERRFKLSRACDRCRRRRIKCDEGHPCQACLAANSACTFEEPGKRTHPHKSKRTATLEDRMHHLETLIQAIPPAVFAAGGNQTTLNSLKSLLADVPGPSTSTPNAFPLGVPPPSLHVFPLTNPSTHFTPPPNPDEQRTSPTTPFQSLMGSLNGSSIAISPEQLEEEVSKMSISDSYLYTDDEGYTRWQGETSGLPFLDLLIERRLPETTEPTDASSPSSPVSQPSETTWFPNRTLRRMDIDPQILWRMITTQIPPDLMDSLVQCYLSTSYYILPFLHVPTFLSDYGNPQKWGQPGFASFIVAICCLASRHVDDPRVRTSPHNGISAGTKWFELLGQLRVLPISDRPTLYTIQTDLVAAVYAVGLGRLSRAAALLSEAITISFDTGLHRSSDTYDLFDPIEDEVRKRTFWCVYVWDKQLSAHFGRPPIVRLKDCDVSEPAPVDDEYITKDGLGTPPPGTECRMEAFIHFLKITMVLESVLDMPIPRPGSSPFMKRVASVLVGSKGSNELRDEEALLDEIHNNIPPYWAQTPDTVASGDIIRLTQAERLYCAEHFVRLLIYRHRFSHRVGERFHSGDEEQKQRQSDAEKEAMIAAHNSAIQIIATHAHIAGKGLMTYYGVHVIHQLTQAGRTLVAVLLCCKSENLQPLIAPGLDALRSCVGLLRRFSGRYVCGLRSGDLLEEFCRLTQIPLEPSQTEIPRDDTRPAWIRPVRKKTISSVTRSSQSGESHHGSPETTPADFFTSDIKPFSTRQSPFTVPATAESTGRPGSIDAELLTDHPHLFLSPDMLTMFDAGGMDVGQILPSEFMQETPQRPTGPLSSNGGSGQ